MKTEQEQVKGGTSGIQKSNNGKCTRFSYNALTKLFHLCMQLNYTPVMPKYKGTLHKF